MTPERMNDYAQYIADHIDASVFLELAYKLSEAEVKEQIGPFLRDKGWRGRKYPLDFFTYRAAGF